MDDQTERDDMLALEVTKPAIGRNLINEALIPSKLLYVGPGQIDVIKAHLAAGNQIAIITRYRTIKLTKAHVDYIRADKEGYRIGWLGKASTYIFNYQIAFVPVGRRI